MTYVIAQPCIDVKDKACVEVCPVDCIHPIDGEMLADVGGEEGEDYLVKESLVG